MAIKPVWSLIVACVLLVAVAAAQSDAETSKCTYKHRYSQPPRGQPPDPVKLKDNAFVRASDGSPIQMKAVSWFGVNDNGTAPIESLWSGGNAAALDMPAIAYQLRTQGFNALRLPFTFSDLRADAKALWSKQGCRKVTLGASAPTVAAAAAAEQPGVPHCSWYLPDGSTLDRFMWSLQWFVANGYYVLAEYHPAGGDTTSHDKGNFVESWRWLWRAITCLPNFKSDLAGRVFVDLLGTPDATGHRWEAVSLGDDGVAMPGITDLYLNAMDALWRETPGAVVFFVASAGQGGADSWGSGFATDKATIAVNDYSDPNAFFKALLKRPYRHAVVISPSVYVSNAPAPPPDDTPTSGAPTKAPAWPEGVGPIKVMDTTFTYLSREGYCAGSDCQRFPVAVGEFASRLTTAKDLGALNAFAAHLAEAGVPYEGVGTWRFWGFEDGTS